ncbi:MAG: lactonase family protein [Aurantibacter sp.]
MKSTPLFIGIICLFFSPEKAQAQRATAKMYNLLIGTYTKPGKSNGIYVYTFNTETGEFNYKAEAGDIKNPSYLAISKDRKQVYSVSEVGEGKGGISAFSFDGSTGKLSFLNSTSSGGNGPCYVSVDDKNKYVFSGNYGGGSVAAIPIKADGSLGTEVQSIQHEGSSINKGNQEGPHVHAAVLSEDNRFLFVPDLGTDKVNIYEVDVTNSRPLAAAEPAFISVEAGSGPRHFTFHPNGKFAYLIQEITGAVTAFNYNDGKLEALQSVVLPPADFKGRVDASDIHISPDGKFLYGALRGDLNELVIYSLDENGKLGYLGRQPTLGETPRNFVIDPSGNYLLVGNQNSDLIVIFKRDKKTGLLRPTGKTIAIGSPVCLKFSPIN